MKHQALFPQKDKSKKIKSSAAIFIWRFKGYKAFFCHALAAITQKLVREVDY